MGASQPCIFHLDLHPGAGVASDVTDGVVNGVGIVGAQLEHHIAARPPGIGESLGNTRIGVRCNGRSFCSPNRSSKTLAPNETVVTVSPSAGIAFQSTALSNGGRPTPESLTGPPRVSRRARSVNTFNNPAS